MDFITSHLFLNAPLISCPIRVISSGWVQQQTHPKWMTGIGQLTKGAFRIKDLLWNPHFTYHILKHYRWQFLKLLPYAPFMIHKSLRQIYTLTASLLELNINKCLTLNDGQMAHPINPIIDMAFIGLNWTLKSFMKVIHDYLLELKKKVLAVASVVEFEACRCSV